ncbi:MAG: hypothetical protein LBG96_00620 [Tannerella sp.]|jgi:C-terminal processing protease CtpA/Prc|nr:hypothetical protein [Tannerella sp.]
MRIKIFFLDLCTIFVFVLSGCNNGEVEEAAGTLDPTIADTEKINKFIIEGVGTYYLWESETDWSLYDDSKTFAAYSDHKKLFERFIYKDDYWSLLTENIDDLENQFEGISTTFGYTLKFYYHPFTGNNEVIAIVLYTTPGSPAASAGLKRGDIIVGMNGGKITDLNYQDLYLASSLVLQCGVLDTEAGSISPVPGVKNMAAVRMYENPVNTSKIIEKAGRRVGYLCYTGYQIESEPELVRVFSDFKSAGVTDVVLDLRYNPGGYSRTALILSSLLAPEHAVKGKKVYLEHYYNDLYTAYLKENGRELSETFIDTLPESACMNLERLYVLTGKNTASASEATMVGLEPYLNVIQIGDTTSGKYCGGILLSPESLYGEKNKNYYATFSNWGMYIMIYRYANVKGITSFTGGLVPAENMLAAENVFDLKPFGDETDPLLGRALAHILGENYVEKRSGKILQPLIPLPDKKRPIDGMLIAEPSFPVRVDPK